MKLIKKVLYLYRVETNTWSNNIETIRNLTFSLRDKYLRELIKREAEITNQVIYDLGGGFNSPKWTVPVDVDLKGANGVVCNLNERWVFEDSSVFAFRATDILEHLPNKLHTMSEIHRCLKPGGYIMIDVPSALGQGAFQDPTHVSYWVENSFKYYTEGRLGKYINNDKEHFHDLGIKTVNYGDIPYISATLQKYGDNVHGYRNI
jgi:SAM-dependent methyltransferase